MNFFYHIKNSFYNPVFYATLSGKTLGSSFKYFYSLIAILAFFIAFVLGSQLSPLFSAENLKKLVALYPSELTLTVMNGVVSTNVTEPYAIKAFKELRDSGRANLVVIDTKSDFSPELFKKYDTNILIGKNFIVSVKNKNLFQFQYTDLAQMPNFTVNQDKLLRWADVIGSYHLALSLGLFVLLFFGFFIFFSVKLLWLLVLALIIFLVAKLRKIQLSYKDSYKFAVQAGTAPFIIEAIFITIGASAPFPFLLSIMLLVVAVVNMEKLHPPVSVTKSTI